ncbi:hypothetical protein MMRN_07880 [Mycobacterium marinum]|nr:hypothetical protein MMRN_07880 [Mycobacterium marinum]
MCGTDGRHVSAWTGSEDDDVIVGHGTHLTAGYGVGPTYRVNTAARSARPYRSGIG